MGNFRIVNLINTMGSLFNGIDDRVLISNSQDQDLANIFEKISEVDLPRSAKVYDFVCCPPDIIAYNSNDKKLQYICSEMNGTGFGGMLNLPRNQLETILNTYKNAAREISDECKKNSEHPLIIIASSGREGTERINGKYSPSTNSKTIWEKLFILDKFAQEMSLSGNLCYVDSFDNIAANYFEHVDAVKGNFCKKNESKFIFNKKMEDAYSDAIVSMTQHCNKPMVLLGYSRDIMECCKINNGQAYLFGRHINGFVNDRAAFNLTKKENKIMDCKKTHVINVSFEEGANKFSALLARDKFHSSTEAKSLPNLAKKRGFFYDVCGLDKIYHLKKQNNSFIGSKVLEENYKTKCFIGVTEEEGIDGIMRTLTAFKNLGMNPLYKPSGTGQGKGIIGYKTGESEINFKLRFYENFDKIKKEFGKGAGYPFLVMPVLNLAKTHLNEFYDLRFVVYQKTRFSGRSTIHTIPLVIKKTPKMQKEYEENNGFFLTNVTYSVSKTQCPSTDFIIPLCREDSFKEVGITKDQVKSMCLYLSVFQGWLLKTKYFRH